jgi:hypothetical protein
VEFFFFWNNGSGYYEVHPNNFPIVAKTIEEAFRLSKVGPGFVDWVVTNSRDENPNKKDATILASCSSDAVWEFHTAHDICVYCGRDNGNIDPATGRGVDRLGFDCFWCLGN